MEENEWDESGTGASTPDKVHSTEAVAEHKSEMNQQLEKHGIEEDTTKEGVWTRKDVMYLGGVIWGTKGGTQGNNVIMGWAIVINKVVNPCHVRDHK